MKKRGEFTWNPIVYGALAIIVLLILFFVFKEQITQHSRSLFDIGDDVTKQAKGEKCQSFFLGQYCSNNDACKDADEIVPGNFDCEKGNACCRKVKSETKEPTS
jgi:hypothetical protein